MAAAAAAAVVVMVVADERWRRGEVLDAAGEGEAAAFEAHGQAASEAPSWRDVHSHSFVWDHKTRLGTRELRGRRMTMLQTVGRPSANGHTRSQPPLQARGMPVVSQLQGRLQPGLSFVLHSTPPAMTSYGELWPAMAGDPNFRTPPPLREAFNKANSSCILLQQILIWLSSPRRAPRHRALTRWPTASIQRLSQVLVQHPSSLAPVLSRTLHRVS
jgi:hypothetical protein